MKKPCSLLVALGTLFIASTSSATDTQNTRVASVRVGIGTPSSGIIEIEASPSGRPGCSNYGDGSGRYFAVDLSTDGGREALKLATAAQLAGSTIRVQGTGSCTVNSNKEDLLAIYVY
jgi:hypothetical protein